MTKEEAITILSDIRSEYNCFSHIEGGRYHALCMGIEALKERKHGKWEVKKIRGDLRTVCSCCKNETGTLYEFDYCPNCGARMVNDDV